MSRAIDLDFEPASKPPVVYHRGLTARFNVALFAFLALMGLGRFLLTASVAREAAFAGIALSALLDAARFLAVVLISAAFLREFWGRLVASLFPVRAINYDEAVAMLLMAALVFGT
ncbi:hypothetical protein [Paludisphaera soli]|uniref:hypothetical protein n=1 Tax=Paludisphaera soli TaxID=2712865 RepID=UPI0013E9C97F|nr:hypothetical protein [Paludisphaera soli]